MFYHHPWVFLIIDLSQHSFYGLNTRETNFFWFESFFEYWFKNCHGSFVEKLLSVWRIISGCQTQPDLPNLPRWLKSHIAFSMFPILDTNLWSWPTKRPFFLVCLHNKRVLLVTKLIHLQNLCQPFMHLYLLNMCVIFFLVFSRFTYCNNSYGTKT